MVEFKEKILYVGRKSVMLEEKTKKNSLLVNFFFLVRYNSGLSEDPSYVEYD